MAPSPKLQAHDVGVPVDVSLKFTSSGACPLVGVAPKPAVGGVGPGGETVINPG